MKNKYLKALKSNKNQADIGVESNARRREVAERAQLYCFACGHAPVPVAWSGYNSS